VSHRGCPRFVSSFSSWLEAFSGPQNDHAARGWRVVAICVQRVGVVTNDRPTTSSIQDLPGPGVATPEWQAVLAFCCPVRRVGFAASVPLNLSNVADVILAEPVWLYDLVWDGHPTPQGPVRRVKLKSLRSRACFQNEPRHLISAATSFRLFQPQGRVHLQKATRRGGRHCAKQIGEFDSCRIGGIKQTPSEQYPGMPSIKVSAQTGRGLRHWRNCSNIPPPPRRLRA